MIYRILTEYASAFQRVGDTYEFIATEHRLGGARRELGDVMDNMKLPLPHHLTNTRTRFYFTERGWRLYGRHILAEGRRRGLKIKLIRRKNPRRSQVVYQDAFQVAILPRPSHR